MVEIPIFLPQLANKSEAWLSTASIFDCQKLFDGLHAVITIGRPSIKSFLSGETGVLFISNMFGTIDRR